MDTIRLGDAGLTVSRVILGMMSYGDPDRGGHSWSLPLDDARPFVRRAVEAGITTFDTANVYSAGSSEEITGALLKEFARREEIVIATKVNGAMHPGPNGKGLSRGAIMTQIDASLQRLGTDYVDLYQIHRFDPETPVAETMAALHDVVKSGKARYIGASSMWTWQFAEMQHTADVEGLTRFVSMQDQYSLLQREEEREMLPYCESNGVGVIPWSPLARGKLTRDWDDTTAQRGRHQGAPPGRRDRRGRPGAHRRRDHRPGGALRPPRRHRVLTRTGPTGGPTAATGRRGRPARRATRPRAS